MTRENYHLIFQRKHAEKIPSVQSFSPFVVQVNT